MQQQQIEIRHAEPDDYRAIQQIHTQPRAIWGTLQIPFPSAEMWRKRLTDKAEGLHALVACLDGRVVGSLGLQVPLHVARRRHVGEIGMAVHDEWQRRGVGRALLTAAVELADNWLNLIRLELTVYTDNAPAIKLYRSFGFEIEGTHAMYAFRSGKLIDAYSMARVQDSRKTRSSGVTSARQLRRVKQGRAK